MRCSDAPDTVPVDSEAAGSGLDARVPESKKLASAAGNVVSSGGRDVSIGGKDGTFESSGGNVESRLGKDVSIGGRVVFT